MDGDSRGIQDGTVGDKQKRFALGIETICEDTGSGGGTKEGGYSEHRREPKRWGHPKWDALGRRCCHGRTGMDEGVALGDTDARWRHHRELRDLRMWVGSRNGETCVEAGIRGLWKATYNTHRIWLTQRSLQEQQSPFDK
ncbi:hypothetical protein B0H13DRAFT_1879190 [Mycena leptocephala]|nr:hypothetical protein B0H13DRAFT_1879190 [Mycena leptocephala]